MDTMIRRLLVANRGEIAVRIIRACRELRIESVAVYSDADASAPHVALADRAFRLGAAPPAESYLHIGRVIDAARETGAEAVHPGYGFLSENAEFASACEAAGLIFVGPPSQAIARMGSKVDARATMQRAGVPIVPGATPADQSDDGLRNAAAQVGYPLMLKASAGGGGKGMRVVREASALSEAVDGARREALAAFANGTLYVERQVERPRHIEIQVLADHHGHIVHLFERECSMQRRHQKVIEESPSVAVTPALRARMGEAAVAAARATGYRNAGTVEFLVEGEGDQARFYFLEMNTRLQVEHPVTEAVSGIDLVHAQLAVAAGARLPWTQEALTLRGHAIECRVYAEDPSSGFLPQAGRLLLYREPSGPGIRVDAGVIEGSDVPVHYDPLLAKLIVNAEHRPAAIRRARAALRQFPVLGVRTNIPFLLALLEHPDVIAGRFDTGFIHRELGALVGAGAALADVAVAAATCVTGVTATAAAAGLPSSGAEARPDPWSTLTGWSRPV